MPEMKSSLRKLLERVETWPETAQDELVRAGLEIEAEQSGPYRATALELQALDEALAQERRGEIASEQEIEDAFAKFRR
jgi:hypothetical protein